MHFSAGRLSSSRLQAQGRRQAGNRRLQLPGGGGQPAHPTGLDQLRTVSPGWKSHPPATGRSHRVGTERIAGLFGQVVRNNSGACHIALRTAHRASAAASPQRPSAAPPSTVPAITAAPSAAARGDGRGGLSLLSRPALLIQRRCPRRPLPVRLDVLAVPVGFDAANPIRQRRVGARTSCQSWLIWPKKIWLSSVARGSSRLVPAG